MVDRDLVLARESDNSLFRQEMAAKLVHEKWTGPRTVANALLKGLSAVLKIERRNGRSRTVSVASRTPVYSRSSDLKHPIGDDFAQIAWGADLSPFVYVDRPAERLPSLEITRKVPRWCFLRLGYGGRIAAQVYTGAATVGTVHALRNLHFPNREQTTPVTRPKTRTVLNGRAFCSFPIDTTVADVTRPEIVRMAK